MTVISDEADDLRLDIPIGCEPLEVLDGARAAGRVIDLGSRTLSQLFLAAVEPAPERERTA